jgi:SSS family solute:Na+ symporter
MRGGVSAVIWTDVVQMFVYAAGAAVIAWWLLAAIDGGWNSVLQAGRAAGRFTVLDLSLDVTRPYTLWAGIFGGVALTLSTHGTDQFLVQRLLSARSAREASAGLVLSGFIVFAQFILFLLIGVMLSTFYLQTPLPQPLTRTDEVLPLFVVTTLPSGVAGFIVAAIVAAALSPSLNAMASTTLADFYLPYVNPDADEATRMRVSKLATVAWGIVQLSVALGAQFMARSVLDAGLSVLSLGSGPVLGAFLLGTLSRAMREHDVFAGMVAGLLVMAVVWWTTPVAFTWYVLIGAATTILVASVSLVTTPARQPAEVG